MTAVSAVLVTRGDVDMTPIIDSLPVDWDWLVYDNSDRRRDLAVYGRYAAIVEASGDLIYVQDDDAVVEDPGRLVTVYEALDRPDAIVANMPERFRQHYPDSCLVGFGTVFHRGLPELMFERFTHRHYTAPDVVEQSWGDFLARNHPTFMRTCDVVVTALAVRMMLDLPYEEREFASNPNRMWRQATHVAERAAMLVQAREVRGDA